MPFKIFVIEDYNLPARVERREFWTKIQDFVKKYSCLQMDFCPQPSENQQDRRYLKAKDGNPFLLESYDLIFIHESDAGYSAKGNYVQDAQKTRKPFISYTGSEISIDASNLDNQQLQKLARRLLVENMESFLTEIENKIKGFDEKKLTEELKKHIIKEAMMIFVRAAIPYSLLPAISILCQGYLVVYAEYLKQEKLDWSQVKNVLKEMGWTEEFLQKSSLKETIAKDIKRKWDEVNQKNWWFSICASKDEWNEQLQNEYKRTGKNEFPDSLKNFVTALNSGDDKLDVNKFPSIVANTYIAITK